ncbi:MAG TPA: triose-phosphate isomerase [Thermomicrobiaceae bacterium]|nr:triose-phosphate isomerase [Thermomicrobiaceae bacterium]
MRKPIVAGNWKMNTSLEEARALTRELVSALGPFDIAERVLIPPFPWLVPVAELLAGSEIELGAQDCAVEDSGAFTGEVSAAMLAPLCRYVVVGHSERRHILGEDDALVAAKLRAALRNGLHPILCVGELLDEREQGRARAVVGRQLDSALGVLEVSEIGRVVVAYEPVWAIGTGRAATPDDAREMAVWIREVVARHAGTDVADEVRVQYGGSVNADNALSFFALPQIDGALVGGASLRADQFTRIVESAASIRL